MLKTWITGTKDFTDQGLAPSEWVNDNVTIVDGGKLGKCMYFNGTSSRLSTTGYTLSNKWSWACWVKEDPSVTAWQLVLMLNTSGSDADSQTALWLKANEHRFEVCNNAKYISTIQYTQGQWNHYAMSFDGTTTKAYLNGSQVATFTSSTIFSKTNLTIGAMGTNANGGHVSASYYLKGYINDLRIWDNEVISPLQAKRLSQGLILHYCLDNNGVGGENLLLNSADLTLWNKESGVYCEYDSTIEMYKIFTTRESSRWGIYQDCDVVVDTDTEYTFSLTGKTDGFSAYLSFGAGATWPSNYTAFTNIKQRLSKTITIPAGTTKIRIYLAMYPQTGGGHVYFDKPKLEKGSVATPWCPNSSDTLYTTIGYNDKIE